VSRYVALGLLLPRGVVTWFVTCSFVTAQILIMHVIAARRQAGSIR
jgi:hypothetical protein